MKAVILIVAIAACSGREPEAAGVGQWRFGKTTRADATGVCQPTDLQDGRKATWCFGQPAYKIGGHVADVDLYFVGTEPTGKLIEIQLKVRGCDEGALDQWMRHAFGVPIENRSSRAYWQNSFLWAAAFMPSEPGRCLVHLLPLSENGEIARIKAL
jgi:hypothetical protein